MSKKLELLRENLNLDFDVKPLYESEINLAGNKVKKLKLIGTAIVCDVEGINGRSYPKKILGPETDRFIKKFVKKGRAAAQLNHPRLSKEGEGKDYSVFEMDLSKVCAIIEELYFEGKDLKCKMRVCDEHAAGKMLKALIDEGYIPGFSLRGAGSVIENSRGVLEVTTDYRLITIDVVGNPSFDEQALITPAYESLMHAEIKVLTEAVDIGRREFLLNNTPKINAGFKKFNRNALVTMLENAEYRKELWS